MDKVYRVYPKDKYEAYIYIHADDIKDWENAEGYEIEETPLYCLTEEELKPEHKIMAKMMKIIRRRSLQEIKKSEADEHGYRSLSAEVRKHNDSGERLCLMRKATPYSTKMDVNIVYEMITDDLNIYYNGVLDYHASKTSGYGEVSLRDKIRYSKKSKDWFKEASPESDAYKFKVYLEGKGVEIGKPIVVDIKQLYANLGSGYYEVSYWATAPI